MSQSILIVDDSFTARSKLKEFLTREGFKTLDAENGHQALELFKTGPVDLVITDVHMPILNGVGLLTNIRSHDKNHDVPVFVLTADPEKSIQMQLRELDVKAWLVKPYEEESLLRAIKLVLAARGQ